MKYKWKYSSTVVVMVFLLRASLCCDYRPDLLSNIRQAINDLDIQVLKSEISTLGGRVKTVFLVTTGEGDNGRAAGLEVLVGSVRAALSTILDKVCASAEYAQELFSPRKRQRVS
ncbi:UNVERIFIED_CONTAM: Transcription factor [Sesamum calycinum]|uniref:Transcription factor n=1 Tax=Sesamum calycinum TaxID=2727403 RepID=A0AAW2MBX4_9LAMI